MFSGGANGLGGGGLASFASKALQYAHNPAALMAEIPSPLLLAGLGITTAAQAATANFAAYRPQYDLQTSLTAAQFGGQLISPALRPLQDKVAADQGDKAYYEAHRNTIYGLAGRIGSLGVADWYYNTHIAPTIDRRTQEDQAELGAEPMRLRFQAVTGVKPGRTDASLSVRNALLNSAGVFGTGALEALQSTSGFADMSVRGYSADDAPSAVSTLYSAAQTQQSGSLYNNLASGKNPITVAQARASLPLLISQGNTSGIESLRPILPGSEVDAALTQARQVFQLGVSGEIASAGFSEAGATVSLLGATGGGYQSIATAVRKEASALDPVRANLEQQASIADAAGNTGTAAGLRARIRQMDAQQKGLNQQAVMGVFTGRGVDTQAMSTGAGVDLYAALHGGSNASVRSGYEEQRKAGLAEAARLEDMSRSPVIAPETRRLLRQEARAKRQEARIGTDITEAQYGYSVTDARIGVQSSQAGAVSLQASLYGDNTDQYTAALGQATVTRAQLGQITSEMNDPKLHMNKESPEYLALRSREISLTADLNKQLAEAPRQLAQMNIALAQTTQGMIQTVGNMAMGALHIGGTQAIGYVGANIGAAQGALSAAQAAVAVLDKQGVAKDSLQYQQALAGVTQAKAGLLGSELSCANIGPSLAVQNKLADSSFQLNVMQRALVPFGNMRGALGEQMDDLGEQMRDLNKQKAASEKALRGQYSGKDLTDALAANDLNFKQQKYEVQSRMVDAQSALSEGWQSRLISQTYNAPSRMNYIASQFTRAEASRFLQDSQLGGAFGFQSAGARDDVQFKYPRLMSTNIGQINRPEGFLASGIEMAQSSPPISGTLRPGSAGTLDITIKLDAKGVATAAVQHNTGRGGNAGVIHSLQNGALTMSVPLHASSVSHQ